MTEQAHTPKPWEISYSAKGRSGQRVRVVGGEYAVVGIATIHALLSQQANAHLIAAAPELLDALQDVVFVLEIMSRIVGPFIGGITEDEFELLANAPIKARAAIAKAKGGGA